MNLRTLITLARPRSATDRRRLQLLVITTGVAGAFLLAGLRVTRMGFANNLPYADYGALGESSAAYSNYLQESGLRSGVVLATVFLAATACALAYQALKLGTAARDRRLAAFRLAGADPGQVRRLGAVEAGMAGLAGGVVAGPMYLVLALVIQALPRVARVLPRPDFWDVVAWPVLAIFLGAATAVLGALLRRGLVTDPLARVESKPVRVVPAVVGAIIGLALIVVGLKAGLGGIGPLGTVIVLLPAAGVLIAAATLAPLLAHWQGKRLSRSADPIRVLAGGRLVRTARAAGRSITLLVLCGSVAGLCFASVVALWRDRSEQFGGPGNLEFYLVGFGLAAFAALAVGLAAGASLLAGTADDLLDQRRNLACLSIFGVGEAHLCRSVRLQLTAIAPPAVAAGLLIGFLMYVQRQPGPQFGTGTAAAWLLIVVGGGAALTWLVAAGAAALLRGQVREAVDPQNLRSA